MVDWKLTSFRLRLKSGEEAHPQVFLSSWKVNSAGKRFHANWLRYLMRHSFLSEKDSAHTRFARVRKAPRYVEPHAMNKICPDVVNFFPNLVVSWLLSLSTSQISKACKRLIGWKRSTSGTGMLVSGSPSFARWNALRRIGTEGQTQ